MDRYDEETARAAAPEARVGRADTYFAKGWVDLLAVGEGGTLAHVTGETGRAYPVRLKARDLSDAACGCADFAETKLPCKHILATAKAANLTSEHAARELSQRLPRLRDELEMEGEADPAGLVEQARDDPALLARLEGRADT